MDEIMYSGIRCVGLESRLLDCPRLIQMKRESRQCDPNTYAAVRCPGKK